MIVNKSDRMSIYNSRVYQLLGLLLLEKTRVTGIIINSQTENGLALINHLVYSTQYSMDTALAWTPGPTSAV
jgi:hypothetical protein